MTTEFVLVEFLDASAPRSLRNRGFDALQILREDQNVEVVGASTDWIAEGLQLFQQHADKEWGLTDCISFVVMKKIGIETAFAFDQHFVQAGFQKLP